MRMNNKESLGEVPSVFLIKELPYPMENVRRNGNKIEANTQEEARSPDLWRHHRGWPNREGLSYKEDILSSSLLQTDIGPKGYRP